MADMTKEDTSRLNKLYKSQENLYNFCFNDLDNDLGKSGEAYLCLKIRMFVVVSCQSKLGIIIWYSGPDICHVCASVSCA